MSKLVRFLVTLSLFSLLALSSLASATNYTLWVNGRGGGGVIGDYNSFSYWGPASTAAEIAEPSAHA